MKITFLGAAKIVTGSSYLLEVGTQRILVDCGMFQGSKTITAFNRRDFPYDPTTIDCVLLTHAHIDHSGLLPKLCKAGFKGTIHATRVTNELCGIMLPDSAHIQEFDAEIANRKGQRAGKKPVEPLYSIDDAYACLKHFSPVDYDSELVISPNVTVRFRDAGHILGSAMLEVMVSEGGKTTKLLFSGDLGQPNQPIIKDPTFIDEADYIIVESTYGNRLHEDYDKEEHLATIINTSVARGGNIIIPSFAVGRTQTLLYYLHNLLKAGKIPDIPVIIDSPLAISATDIFLRNTQDYDNEAKEMLFKDHDNPLHMPQLRFTKTADESKALNNLEQPAIIISASGMCDAGRILHHLKHNLWRPESTVLFVGYQAQGSLGRRLVEGASKVKILGEEISVKATIHRLDGFSAHADQGQLLNWLSYFKRKAANIFLVHGEPEMSEPFAKIIKEKLDVSTYIPNYGDVAVLDGALWKVDEAKVVDPAVKQLHDYLELLDREYAEYRKQLEQLGNADNHKITEIMSNIEKLQSHLGKQ
ncbi:MBL fold metallo-hydrolase RNA specificity domain-containing protein [Pelosinus sp. UFO1]|uniref:MBL fold metallo-hydrolase RNA specificity domain-containing protein n=1 Tax=Pelosinus sp. UFO1 TaxID=484770 RepID=UPI0004D1C10B|nr:MBL fold metallo-hydrolase [Pelosinus sp. UFO1]AIF51082.1 Beta-Casp domain containing protein [Pelosinus sp. UFO1]